MAADALSSMIYQLRKKLKLTQVQLADKVGVSGAAISHFEKGNIRPGYETVKRLSEALGFDFSALYLEEQNEVISASEIHTARLWIQNRRRYESYNNHSFDTSHLHPEQFQESTEVPMHRQSDFIAFVLDPRNDEDTKNANGPVYATVLQLPGVDYTLAIVLELQGNSMAPRYPDGSRYVLFPIKDEHWQYATGVHAIWLKSKKLLIKRIVSNKKGILTLQSDSTGDQTTVEIDDVAAVWRAGQAIHLPPEEL